MIGEFRARQRSASVVLWAVGEILIVTVGVLFAFGLNAWWVERGARSEEQSHLRALIRDFETNVGIYSEIMGRAQTSSSASLELLQLARKQPDADPVMVRSLLGRVFQSYRMKPALDAYEALVGSAGLTLIRDETLRASLAGFADRAIEPYAERFADQLYLDLTTRYIGRLQLAGVVAGEADMPEPYSELLGDPVFQEHLAYRHLLERDVAGLYEDRLHAARDILERLRAATDSRASVAIKHEKKSVTN